MSSPPRLRRSPKRQALHERSHSHANEILAPTLRVVGDADAKVYASNPYPTQESQVLSPRGRRVFDPDVSVSYPSQPTAATLPSSVPEHINAPGHAWPPPSAHDGSPSEILQFAQHSPSSLSAKEPSQSSDSPSSIGVDRLDMDGGLGHNERVSDEIIQLPSVPGGREGSRRALGLVPMTPNQNNRASLRAIASVASHLSLDSAESTETVVKKKINGPPPRGSYILYPLASSRPTSSRSTRASSTPARPNEFEQNRVSLSPVSSGSPTSPVSPMSPTAQNFDTPPPRVYQAPQHARSDTALDSSPPKVQYAEVRDPTASGSYALDGSGFRIPRRPVAGSGHPPPAKWNSHLSTIASETSDERSSWNDGSPPMRLEESSQPSSLANDRSSGYSYYTPVPPQPAFMRHKDRDVTNSTIRVVTDEDHHVLVPHSQTSLRQQGTVLSVGPTGGENAGSSQYNVIRQAAGSRGSFLRDSIPAWARTYYAHEGRNLLLAAQSGAVENRPATHESQSSITYGMFRARTRPQEIRTRDSNTDSMAITPAIPNAAPIVEVIGSPRRRANQEWSPHLWHDRRSAIDRRTIFIAPSLDEEAEGKAVSRRNLQVWLFALGFILPPAWIIASCLPLPPAPTVTPPATPNPSNIAHDIEKALGPIDQARYENARWWRNINRIMSIIGVFIILAIIILVVVATRTNS